MKYLLIAILFFVIFSCSMNRLQNKKWENDPPYNFSGENIDFFILPKIYEDEYFMILTKEAYCIFPQDIFKEITGLQNTKNHIIAVRAVYTNLGGKYEVLQNENGEISVSYRVLGKVTKVNKGILLLQVDVLPSNIYVYYTGAR